MKQTMLVILLLLNILVLGCSCVKMVSDTTTDAKLDSVKKILGDTATQILFHSDSVLLYSIKLDVDTIDSTMQVINGFVIDKQELVLTDTQYVEIQSLLLDSNLNCRHDFLPSTPFRPLVVMEFYREESPRGYVFFSPNAGVMDVALDENSLLTYRVSNRVEWLTLFSTLLPNNETMNLYLNDIQNPTDSINEQVNL